MPHCDHQCQKNVHLLSSCILLQETPNGQKKKIIPIGSDFEEMSPSPEFPHSPVETAHIESVLEEVEKANLHKNKKMNFKWKSSVSKYIFFLDLHIVLSNKVLRHEIIQNYDNQKMFLQLGNTHKSNWLCDLKWNHFSVGEWMLTIQKVDFKLPGLPFITIYWMKNEVNT